MSHIVVHISAPRQVAAALIGTPREGIEVISSRDLSWTDSPRFGVGEAMLIIAIIKEAAELTRVVLEIIDLLKKTDLPNAIAKLESPTGEGVSIQSDSNPTYIIQELERLTSFHIERDR